ncbi:MAG TPA: GNAT family N-acetyltransferase [Anaerolineales bacterium]|nr:GNAT family N-acetyltransferase [Anaerolineales bacterium]
MYIGKVLEPSDQLSEALQRLIPQLGIHKDIPAHQELKALLEAPGSTLLVAREPDKNGEIVGMLSLTVYRVPTGVRSIVEDVVVDQKMRQRGVGEALIRQAIELARQADASGVALTSNPQREAANRLYRSIGFELRKTNPYFYKLK